MRLVYRCKGCLFCHPRLNSCIGAHNYRAFAVCIFSVAVMTGTVLAVSSYLIVDFIINDEFQERFQENPIFSNAPKDGKRERRHYRSSQSCSPVPACPAVVSGRSANGGGGGRGIERSRRGGGEGPTPTFGDRRCSCVSNTFTC